MHGFGVRPAACVGDVGSDHVRVEVVTEVEDVVLDAEAARHAAGIVDVGHRAATRVGLATPELQRDPHHVVTGLQQERGGHRGVDATGHGHEHAGHAGAPSRCVGLEASGDVGDGDDGARRCPRRSWTTRSTAAATHPRWRGRCRARRARATAPGRRSRSSTRPTRARDARARAGRATPRCPPPAGTRWRCRRRGGRARRRARRSRWRRAPPP